MTDQVADARPSLCHEIKHLAAAPRVASPLPDEC